MSWNSLSEQRIREAIQSGELSLPEDLHGQSLNLDDYFATPEGLRVGYSVLKSGGYVPLEVTLLKQLRALEKAAQEEADPLRRSELHRLMAEVNVRLNLK